MKFRIILPTFYALLYIASIILMYTLRERSAFAGVWSVILTTPWSLLLSMLLGKLFGGLGSSPWIAYVFSTAIAAFNGLIYFFTGWGIDSWLATRKK